MSYEFKIPLETVDDIVLSSLKEDYRMSKKQLDNWYEGIGWLHRDDIDNLSVLMFHLKAVIDYYGGSVE